MDAVKECTNKLVDCICGDAMYQRYVGLAQAIKSDYTLNKLINDYRKKQVRLQMMKENGDYVSDDERMQLSSLYSQITLNQTAVEFLDCECGVMDMLARIFETLHQKTQLDLDFL